MKHLFLVVLLFAVSMTAVSAQQKSDSYTFDSYIVWTNEYYSAEEESGESDDNFTQYFSDKGNYVGNSEFGGGYLIRDYANNSEVFMIDEQGTVKELETSSYGISFKLSETEEEEAILGYNTKKYTWKDNDGRTGEIWFATDLDFPSAKGVNYPFGTLLPNVPSGLGVVLKANGRLTNGDTFDMEASQIQTESFTVNTSNYTFKN